MPSLGSRSEVTTLHSVMPDVTSDLQELSNFRILVLRSLTVRNVIHTYIHTYEEAGMSRVMDLLLPYVKTRRIRKQLLT